MIAKPEMVWIDLETTGLDANLDVPLEIAFILTNKYGEEIDYASQLIFEHAPDFDRGVSRGLDNEIVKDMHEKSGLWEELATHPTYTRSFIEDYFIGWLSQQGVAAGTLPMCGNSVGSLDRPFIIAHFPKLNKFLHYRNIDMSSDKELLKMHRPDLYEELKPIIGTKEDATHRALDDCRASIREYQTYLEHWYKV